MFKRGHKVEIDRDTMCRWTKRCAELLPRQWKQARERAAAAPAKPAAGAP